MARSSTPEVALEPLPGGSVDARRLFAYAGAWAPPLGGDIAWGAFVGDGPGRGLVGAVLLEVRGAAGMLHGPVVVAEGPGAPDAVEVAAALLARLLPLAAERGVRTLFARPQGLDRVWVRFGFIPVPEMDLPRAFRGRPGTGLFAWRGGSALWSSRQPSRPDDTPAAGPGLAPRRRARRGAG